MIRQALSWLNPSQGTVAADFFAGLGNFAIPLARGGADVRAFELDAAMVARGHANAERAGVTVDYREFDLFDPAPAVLELAELALLDPPRAGAHSLCALLASAPVQRVLYVSCDPATLERDLRLLLAGGYRIERAGIADMFPHTHHLESMVLLTQPRPGASEGPRRRKDQGLRSPAKPGLPPG